VCVCVRVYVCVFACVYVCMYLHIPQSRAPGLNTGIPAPDTYLDHLILAF